MLLLTLPPLHALAAGSENKLEIVAQSDDAVWNGVAVNKDGRVLWHQFVRGIHGFSVSMADPPHVHLSRVIVREANSGIRTSQLRPNKLRPRRGT